MNPVWRLKNSTLGLLHSDGSFRVPSAEEVFEARFGDLPHGDQQTSLAEDPTLATVRLDFERFPARMKLEIRQPEHSGQKFRTLLQLLTKRGPVPIVPPSAALFGHVVVADRWIPIMPDDVDQLTSLVSHIGDDLFTEITLRQFLKLRLISGDNGIVDDSEISTSTTISSAVPPFLLHTGIDSKLYSYQRIGATWLARLASQDVGGILADEMGLGKTIQLIGFMCHLHEQGKGPALVIGPSSILENWRRELELFAPELKVLVHQGPARTGFPSVIRSNDVTITSYDTVVRDVVLLSQVKWDVLVADEAQFLKNPHTQRSASVRSINSRIVIASTGTPIENSLRDLWSLTDLVIPGLLMDKHSFLAQYPDEPAAAARLADIVAPAVLRRRLTEVARDLPSRIVIPSRLKFGEQEALNYESLRSAIAALPGSVSFASLVKLRMFCAHPGLLSGDLTNPTDGSMKFTRLTEILDEIFSCNEKALIFASFKQAIDLIVTDVEQRFGVPSSSLDGRTPVTTRQTLIDDFASRRGSAVLVLNPHAAGTGLNITPANHVIHYTLGWNPAIEDQATARAHRLGQTRPVTVHRLFYVDSVEEVINDRLDRKRDLISTALPADDSGTFSNVDILAAIQRSPVHKRISAD